NEDMRPHPLFQNHRGFSSFFRRIDVHELYITLGSGLVLGTLIVVRMVVRAITYQEQELEVTAEST
ncbi:MAG: hypothetical protein ACXVBG_19945, partial [Isosphaeraceae bacterium]